MTEGTSLIGGWVLFAFTLPWTLLMWLVGLLAMATWIAYKPRFVGFGVLTLTWRPWFEKRWRFSTTLGRTVFYRSSATTTREPYDGRIERHELVHVRQLEDSMVRSFIVGGFVAMIVNDWRYWLALWIAGGFLFGIAYITGAIRYGLMNGYRDAEIERSAYAQTDINVLGSEASWWGYRDRRRRER